MIYVPEKDRYILYWCGLKGDDYVFSPMSGTTTLTEPKTEISDFIKMR